MVTVRRIPVTDHLWLIATLKEALAGGPAVYPVASDDAPQPPVLPEGTAVVIHTSGSSGTPKFVAHTADSIRASAVATNEALGGPGQWLVTLPTHLIAGFQMLTRSVLAETEPVIVTGKLSPKKFLTHTRELTGERRYVSLVPAQLMTLLEAADEHADLAAALTSIDAVLVGGQHVPLDLRQRAHTAGITLVRTYGMTETGGGAVYDGVEIGDTRVRIRENEIQLAGSSLALGYAGDTALTDASFITDAGERWFRTGDTGQLLGGMLQVTGRLDRVIISGGVNVSLDRVEALINAEAPWNVTRIVCLAGDDERWGEHVRLVVETGDAKTGDAETSNAVRDQWDDAFVSLQEWVRGELGPAAVPKTLTRVRHIPTLANHKIDYQRLQEEPTT